MKYYDIERLKDFDGVYTFVLCERNQRKVGMGEKEFDKAKNTNMKKTTREQTERII